MSEIVIDDFDKSFVFIFAMKSELIAH